MAVSSGTMPTELNDETGDSIPLEDIDAELESTRKEIQELETESEN